MSFEGESSGTGGDRSVNQEGLELRELNREWAELNERLGARDAEQERLAVEQAAVKDAFVWKLYDQLDERRIMRLLHEDPDIETARRHEFMERTYGEKLADISWMRSSAEGSDASLAYLDKALQTLAAYVRECRVQRLVVMNAADILHGAANGAVLPAESLKKTVQAELHVHYQLQFTDNWMQFFDDVTPGGGIVSLSYPMDKPYVEAARESRQQFEDACKYEEIVLETAIDLATYKNQPDFWSDPAEVARTLSAIAGLYAIAMADHGDEYGAAARRNRQLWHYGYATGLSSEVLSEIIDYFELSNSGWEE